MTGKPFNNDFLVRKDAFMSFALGFQPEFDGSNLII